MVAVPGTNRMSCSTLRGRSNPRRTFPIDRWKKPRAGAAKPLCNKILNPDTRFYFCGCPTSRVRTPGSRAVGLLYRTTVEGFSCLDRRQVIRSDGSPGHTSSVKRSTSLSLVSLEQILQLAAAECTHCTMRDRGIYKGQGKTTSDRHGRL